MMLGLSIFLLAGCVSSGDFCDVYQPVTMAEDVARAVVAGDRDAAENIAANQLTWGRQCAQ